MSVWSTDPTGIVVFNIEREWRTLVIDRSLIVFVQIVVVSDARVVEVMCRGMTEKLTIKIDLVWPIDRVENTQADYDAWRRGAELRQKRRDEAAKNIYESIVEESANVLWTYNGNGWLRTPDKKP